MGRGWGRGGRARRPAVVLRFVWALRTARAPHVRRRTPRQWERLGGEWAVGPAVRLGSGGPLWARGGPGLGACPAAAPRGGGGELRREDRGP